MAGVNNVTGLYNSSNRKISSKLSFDVGESFTGRIVKTDSSSKDVVIKLLDGWQFPAELEKPLELVPNGLLRFQVEGFEEGKLQIKLVNIKDENKDSESSSLDDVIKEQNLSTKDSGLLERMVKFGIPLTKENVSRIKTIIGFSNKMKENEDEEEAFIQKYLKSKDIEPGSEKAQEIRNTLKGFFSKLKDMSEEEILTLLENNVDLTEENIDSFNNVFKGSSSIYRTLVKEMGKEVLQAKMLPTEEFIQGFMKSSNIEPGSENEKQIRSIIKNIFSDLKGLSKDEIQTVLKYGDDLTEAFVQKNMKSENINPDSEKAAGIRSTVKDIFLKLKELPEDKIQAVIENNIDLPEQNIDSFNKVFKENSSTADAFIKEIPKGMVQTESLQAEDFIQEFMNDRNIETGSEDEKNIRNIIKDVFSNLEGLSKDEIQTVLKHDVELTEVFIQKNIKNENIKSGSEKGEEIRSTIRNLFSRLKELPENDIKSMLQNKFALPKENISNLNKVFSENSNVPKTFVKEILKDTVQTEPFKAEKFIQEFMKNENIKPSSKNAEDVRSMLKDFFSKLKDMPEEKIKTLLENKVDLFKKDIKGLNENVKENISVSKTIVEETAKGALQTEEFIQEFVKNENISPGSEKAAQVRSTLKELFSKLKEMPEKEIKALLEKNIDLGEENIYKTNKNLKENVNISNGITKGMTKEKLQAENNSTVQLIKQEIELKTEQMKTAIEKLLNTKDNVNPETFSKVLVNLKENLSDFKVFNSVSNQYYYMDVPLNIKETNYDFKLIVKDDRKSGKKLDSKNIKLAASVDTINLGIVDAYFKVMNGKMDIEIKCETPYVKLINSGKTILEKELSNIGYSVNIAVNKRDKEMNIVNCRDFFGENNLNGINVVV